MIRTHYLLPVVLLSALLLVQCKKDKKESEDDGPTGITKGLIAWFKLDNNFNDASGNIPLTTYTTTGITAVTDRHGKAAGAMEFDGGNMQVPVTKLPANPITISVWIKIKELLNGCYLLQSDEGAFGIYQDKSTLGMAISTPATNSAMAFVGKGWVHLTGTYDGKDINVYINGVLKKTLAHPGEPDNTNQIAIGTIGNGAIKWKGSIDDLRIYNRVLHEREIQSLAELK
jgi:hypothetical protein